MKNYLRSGSKRKNVRRKLSNIYAWIIALCFFLFSTAPIVWMISTSLKSRIQAFSIPPVWLFIPTLRNYQDLFVEHNFVSCFANTLIMASFSTLVVVVAASLAGYALARYNFKWNREVAFSILILRIIPTVALVLPLYTLWQRTGLYNTYHGMIIVYSAMNLPLAIWLLRGFIMAVPKQLEEAAIIDGCSWSQAFLKIIFPLISPGLAATAILCFILSWNEFLFALVLTGPHTQTMPITLSQFAGRRGIEYGSICAMGTLIIAAPLGFIIFAQKHITRALGGALKG